MKRAASDPPLSRQTFESWAALFVTSPSPGAILRFIERRLARKASEKAALDKLDLRLSNANAQSNQRTLQPVGDPVQFREWAERNGPAFSLAFPDEPVILLWAKYREGWGYIIWSEGQETERQSIPLLPKPLPNANLWQRFFPPGPGPEAPSLAAVAWARDRNAYGVGHIAVLHGHVYRAAERPKEIDYTTIARLDERGLLVEDRPRLYRYSFTPPATTE